ncbi:MAG: hypothetical protein GY951_12390 [Psychromonas sp.]|nr:hypothetical protein [Alteromonadales bacterium]MCP5078839.1 hypothetical protein [Psychromonas sp.]
MKKLLLFLLHALITVLLWRYFSTVDSSTQNVIHKIATINSNVSDEIFLFDNASDYNTYLNNKYSVIPENNMAMPLLSVFGISSFYTSFDSAFDEQENLLAIQQGQQLLEKN